MGVDVDPDRLARLEALGVDGVADHGRGPGHRTADVEAPLLLAAERIQRVEALVVGADVDRRRRTGRLGDRGEP
jgi:hypothetical protein